MKLPRALQSNFLVYIIIIFGIYDVFEGLSHLTLNTADASTYLNIAENVVSHRGFVVSFNLYQFFTTHYHPIWPYIQPVFPLLCALVFMAHGGIVQVIQTNIFILGLNAALIFYILQVYIPNRLNILFLVWLIFSPNVFYSSMFAWTEQSYLFLYLISFIIFLRWSHVTKAIFWIGTLNGVLFLARAAHVYCLVPYALMILWGEGSVSQRLKRALLFTGGFLLVVGAYQWINYTVYHSFYPEYLKPAVGYTQARISSLSTYRDGYAGLYDPLGEKFRFIYLYRHLVEFFKFVFIFFIPVVAYLCLTRRKREGHYFLFNCVSKSIFIIGGYSLSLGWEASTEFLRYSLVPFILSALAGWFCVREVLLADGIKWKEIGVAVMIGLLALITVHHFFENRRYFMTHPRSKDIYFIELYQAYRWIDKNLPPDVLVASDEDQEGYFLHRPYISMPPGKSYNCTNVALFNARYQPDYYVQTWPADDKCFSSIPHSKVFSNPGFTVLKVKKN